MPCLRPNLINLNISSGVGGVVICDIDKNGVDSCELFDFICYLKK